MPEPFPLGALPGPLARLAEECALAFPCPPDFVAVPGLVVLATMIGTTRELQVKGGWREGPRIYAAVVADPGTKKSPALAIASEPLTRVQAKYRTEYEVALLLYELDKQTFEALRDRYRAEVKKDGATYGLEPPQPPREPRMRLAYTTDSTWEALAHALEDSPRGLAFKADELTGWALAMNAYKAGKGADRQHWLSAWAGSSIVVNRRSLREPIDIPRPFIAVAGCLPPDVLSDLEDERGREDGFLHRILFSFPAPVPLAFPDHEVSPETVESYCELARHLHELQPADDRSPVVLKFTNDGLHALRTFFNEELHPATNSAPSNLAGPFAKLEAYAVRLALVLHECRFLLGHSPAEQVDRVSVEQAAELVRYFISHTRAVYALLRATADNRHDERFIRWMQRQSTPVTARDIQRAEVLPKDRKANEIKDYLDDLAKNNLLVVDDYTRPSGQPRRTYRLPDKAPDTRQSPAKPDPEPDPASDTAPDNSLTERPTPTIVGDTSGPPPDPQPRSPSGLDETCRVSGDPEAPKQRDSDEDEPSYPAPCRYPHHRSSDWQTHAGDWRCGECHPPAPGAEHETGEPA